MHFSCSSALRDSLFCPCNSHCSIGCVCLFFSSARSDASAEVFPVVPDDEKDAPSKISLEECSILSHGMDKQELEQVCVWI